MNVNEPDSSATPAVPHPPGTPVNPPAGGTPPPLGSPAPPHLSKPPKPNGNIFAVLLSLFLMLVLANAAVSAIDDSFLWFFGTSALNPVAEIFTLCTGLATILVYALMGITPMVPKRFFLPATFVVIMPFFAGLPLLIYHYREALQIDWLLSWGSLGLGLAIVLWINRGSKWRWPIVPQSYLRTRAFSWRNLLFFALLTFCLLLPAGLAYLGGCVSLAVSHFSDGFVALRPSGVILQARKYTRDDGRTIVLIPMSHIAESDFYKSVAQSVTSNSVVLMEGVTDTKKLLKHRLTYQRAAKSLHLADQHDDFDLTRGKLVRADVDVQDFSSNTIAALNLIAAVHEEGINAHTISLLLSYSPSPDVEEELLDDILLKRNQHLIKELFDRLPNAHNFIIPWGAAHMAGISQAIKQAGFHLVGTRNYVSIRFVGKAGNSGASGWTPVPDGS